MPFRERITDVEDIGTSSIVNQVVFTFLFVASCFSLLPKVKDVISFVRREKFLFLFLSWCLFSVAWSDHSFVSIKRLFRDLTVLTVCLAVLLHSNSSNELLKFFKYILFICIILTVLSIALVPAATDQHGYWRGLTMHKNQLGQICLLSSILWFCAMRFGRYWNRLLCLLMVLLSVVLLFGSNSMTSILTLLLLIIFGILLYISNISRQFGVGLLYSFFMMISFLGIVGATIFWTQDITSSFFDAIGKDSTFTGRTDLWADIFYEETKNHLFHGCGFGGFWVVDNPNLLEIYEVYNWLPNEAHNGYFDILNETGVIGLILVLIMIFSYFINLVKLKKPHPWKWFFVAPLILNLQESTLFRHGILTGVFFIFAYLALNVDLYKEKCHIYQSSVKKNRQ